MIFLNIIEFLKVVLITIIATLTMPAKLATPGPLKITVLWKKRLRRQNIGLWRHHQNSSFSMKEISNNFNFIRIWPEKQILKRWSWFKFNNLGLVLGVTLTIYSREAERFKLKVRKFWWPLHTFWEVKRVKLVLGTPSWIGINCPLQIELHVNMF